MELDLLQIFGGFAFGLIVGVIAMLVLNKVKSGSASPAGVKQEFEDYKNEVEAHFEATSKKFQNMTEQYQDLYQHLSVGATSLCRPDSVAAALVDGSDPSSKPAQIEADVANSADGTGVDDAASGDAATDSSKVETTDTDSSVESAAESDPVETKQHSSDTGSNADQNEAQEKTAGEDKEK